ncbi:MAG: 50S ribosomal protein L5 [Candidatus Micrarchaeota archaeon]|nr:50S ribosomal protein L5 [Candidatus Micrarchaeota archaeon]
MADNSMKDITLEKLVINIGIGSNEQLLQNSKALIQKLTGRNAVPTVAKKRDPSLNIRRGQIIGAMVTLRKDAAAEMLKKALDANNNVVKERSINDNSFSFGIKEYIDFTGVKYDPKIGMLGMNINANFARKGKRVEMRRRARSISGYDHKKVTKDEIINYITTAFNAKVTNE